MMQRKVWWNIAKPNNTGLTTLPKTKKQSRNEGKTRENSTLGSFLLKTE
jgi:hypothetical protein